MTIRLDWVASAGHAGICVSGSARVEGHPTTMATATAEVLLLDPTDYGVPADIPQGLVYRFSRCKAQPKGKGGGSVALHAALEVLDGLGAWSVLEASPYPGQNRETLHAFYEKHGFQHNPNEKGLMFRPPRGT